MARIDYPELASAGEPMAALARRIRDERGGRLLNLYRMLLHSPPMAAGWLQLGTAVRQQAGLDAATRELAICRVARLTQADYEWQAHRPLALEAGLTAEQIEHLEGWRESARFDERQRAVLAYAEAMTAQIEVDETTFANVRAHFDPRAIVELTVTIGFYNLVSRVLVALAIDPEP